MQCTCIRMYGKLFAPLNTSVRSLHREQFIGLNIFDSVFPFLRIVGNSRNTTGRCNGCFMINKFILVDFTDRTVLNARGS